MEIIDTIYNHELITYVEFEKIRTAHKKIHFKRNHFFLQAGEIAREYYLIESGLVRTYVIDPEGSEMTTDFVRNKQVLIEAASMFQHIPTVEYQQAISDGVAWKIHFDDFQKLFHNYEGVREWGRNWMISQWFDLKRRTNEMITKSAMDRYLALMEENPQIIREVPLKHIASYLGITDSSLSRIRREILKCD